MNQELHDMMKKHEIDIDEMCRMNEMNIGLYSRKKNRIIDLSFQMEPLLTVLNIQGDLVNFLNQKLWYAIFDYIETLPKIADKPLLISIKDFLEEDEQMIKNVLRRKEYVAPTKKKQDEISQLIGLYTFSANRIGSYMCKESDIGRFKQIIPIVAALNKCVLETMNKERLFEYRILSFHAFEIYMHGFQGEMILKVKKDACEVVIKTKENKEIYNWTVSQPTDIDVCMKDFLSSIDKNMRIKNSLQPPDRFYKRWIRGIARNQKEQYDMHQSFLTFFSPLEVEEFAAYFCKNAAKDQEKRLDERHLLYFYNEYVVLVAAEEAKIFVFEQNEQWKERVTNTLVELRRQYIDNELKDIS